MLAVEAPSRLSSWITVELDTASNEYPWPGSPISPECRLIPRCELAFTWLCRTMRWLLSERLKSRRAKNLRSSVSRWRLSSKPPGL